MKTVDLSIGAEVDRPGHFIAEIRPISRGKKPTCFRLTSEELAGLIERAGDMLNSRADEFGGALVTVPFESVRVHLRAEAGALN